MICTSAPARFRSCENGQPSSACSTTRLERSVVDPFDRNHGLDMRARRSGGPALRPRPSRSCRSTSSRPGGVPAFVSSPASDIVMQPPCAAASSSSGLVLPSASPMRVGSENPSSENAPELAAVIEPAPRATFPSQTRLRGALDPAASVGSRGRRAVRVIRLGRRPGRAEDAEHAASRPGPTFSRQCTRPAGRCTQRAGAERRGLAVDVQRAVALEHVDDLVVFVEVVGCAARRGCSRRTASPTRSRASGVASSRNWRPAVAAPLSTDVDRDDGVGRAVRRQRVADEDREQLEPVGLVDPPGRAVGDEGRRPGARARRLAADRALDRCPRAT